MATASTNLVLNICLPKGLALVTGQTLMRDVTLNVVSSLYPFYAGIDQVKLIGGYALRSTSDLTIACTIYNVSKEADMISPHSLWPFPNTPEYQRLFNCRSQWVIAKSARDLILNLIGLVGSPGSHVLANFSVTRSKGGDTESIAAKVNELNDQLKKYVISIASHGSTLPGGHARAAFGAKGVRDWHEKTPSRQWSTTGVGANAVGPDFLSRNGGRGKPEHHFNRLYCSPSIVNWRSGVYLGSFPLTTTFGECGNASGYGMRAGGGW